MPECCWWMPHSTVQWRWGKKVVWRVTFRRAIGAVVVYWDCWYVARLLGVSRHDVRPSVQEFHGSLSSTRAWVTGWTV